MRARQCMRLDIKCLCLHSMTHGVCVSLFALIINADTLSSVSHNRCGVQCNKAAGFTSAGKSNFGYFDCPINGGDATTGFSCQGQI